MPNPLRLQAPTLADKTLTPTEVKNLALSQGFALTKQTFKHKAGKLGVSLAFRGEGAKLALKLFTPDGKVIQHTDTTSFLLEVEDAPAGTWGYTVTALEAPYDNFPFTVMIGSSKWAK